MNRYIDLLNALRAQPSPSKQDLYEKTHIPSSSLHRMIKVLRRYGKMDIHYIRKADGVRGSGYYSIASWGVINEQKFIECYGHKPFGSTRTR